MKLIVNKPNRRGFTLIEILAVILIIGLLASMLLPALSAAREAGRSVQCKSNLRQFGQGMHIYADTHNDQLCSGAFDWNRDGAVTEIGWVADLVNQGIDVGNMLCPTNDYKLSEKFNDLLGETATGLDSCGVDHEGSEQGMRPDGTFLVNPCRLILGTWTGTWDAPWGTTYTGGMALAPGSEERRQVVEEMILLANYNSNYAASWFLVRGGVSLDEFGNLTSAGMGCPASNKERASTKGPLRRTSAENGIVASSQIPLLGCAAPGDVKEAILTQQLGPYPSGTRLCESFCDGPVRSETMRPPQFGFTSVYGGPGGWWDVWTNRTLQDYRDFAPVHGAKQGTCNLLFADGSVRTFVDENQDGYLNPGFDPSLYAGAGSMGYTTSEVELPPNEVFAKWSLSGSGKGNLDQQ